MLRELQGATEVFLCVVNWWTILDGKQFFDQPGDHGGELETSLMMHLQPDLVFLDQAGDGRTNRFRVQALKEGWAWAPREWRRATVDTGSGDPSRASAEKGARFFAAVTEKIAGFLFELSTVSPDSIYEGE